MICKDIIEQLNKLANPKYALDYDNVGLLVGRDDKEIHKIVVALEIDDNVIDKAIDMQADMIITHHPMIFGSIKRVNNQDITGKRIIKLISNDISYFAMHTNYDIAGGMVDDAVSLLKLKETEVLEVTETIDNAQDIGVGAVGILENPMKISVIAQIIKEHMGLKYVTLFGDADRAVSKIAISPGSGEGEIDIALNKKCDMLITGDIRHHKGEYAVDNGMAVMDATHYGLEHVFSTNIMEYIKHSINNDLDVHIIDDGCPIKVL